MKPKNIILIRHGFSVANQDKSVIHHTPDYACSLTDLGREQANKAGEEINKQISGKTMFYCSPHWRTRQTYLHLKNSIKSFGFREDPRLREQEYGTRLGQLDSYLEDAKHRNNYGHFYFRNISGESAADVYNRICSFSKTLFHDFESPDFPENVIIVTHGLTLKILLMKFLELSVEAFEILKGPKNCEYHRLELESGRYVLKTLLAKHEQHTHEFQFDWVAEAKRAKDFC